MENFTSARQAKAYWKSGRALPCGCRVKGQNRPTAILSCDEAKRLEAAAEAACPLYGPRDPEAHQAALEALWAHRMATPTYLGGR